MNSEATYSMDLVVSPTCPPTPAVAVRGGYVFLSGYWAAMGDVRTIVSTTLDFTDLFADFTGYIGCILCLTAAAWQRSAPEFAAVVRNTIRASAIEAEDDIAYILSGTTGLYVEQIPLWGVVLKDLQPVDGVNRGRSYLWRDVRPRHKVMPRP